MSEELEVSVDGEDGYITPEPIDENKPISVVFERIAIDPKQPIPRDTGDE